MGEMTNGVMVFWLTTPQVAQIAGCTVNVVNAACRKGELRAVRPQTPQNEGRWMVRQPDAEVWAKARTARAALLAQKREDKAARLSASLKRRSASLGQRGKDFGVPEPGANLQYTPEPIQERLDDLQRTIHALQKTADDNRKLLLALCGELGVKELGIG